MQNQKLCLKWNNHMSNMLSLLGSFQQKDMLVDVTISCQGQNIKAHKVILSACSQYFQNIFMENPCQHPIIIINGMKFEDVSAILNFMYKGEVNVSQDGLSSFLQAAEALKVKGLAEVCGEKKGTNSITQEVQQSEVNRPQRTDTPPRKRPRNRKRSLSDSNRSDDEGLTRKHREPSSPEVHELSGDESFTGDNSSNGPPFNSVPRVPHNVYSHSRSHQSSNIADEDEEYDVESNKMLDTSDSNQVSMNNNADNNLRIERIMGNTEIESSSLQEPESPPDIKPIISYGESSAGTSESGAMMLYNEQSQPGPSNAQDGSLLHDNSHTQDDKLQGTSWPKKFKIPVERFSWMLKKGISSGNISFGQECELINHLASEIAKYTKNPTQHQREQVVEALVETYPQLKCKFGKSDNSPTSVLSLRISDKMQKIRRKKRSYLAGVNTRKNLKIVKISSVET